MSDAVFAFSARLNEGQDVVDGFTGDAATRTHQKTSPPSNGFVTAHPLGVCGVTDMPGGGVTERYVGCYAQVRCSVYARYVGCYARPLRRCYGKRYGPLPPTDPSSERGLLAVSPASAIAKRAFRTDAVTGTWSRSRRPTASVPGGQESSTSS
jgi:hypothetical protein